MGWWKIDSVESGRIDHEYSREHRAGCANAVPGDARDAKELLNGDEPADLMGAALDTIADRYRRAWGRNPKLDELRAVFAFVVGPEMQRADGEYTGGARHRVTVRPATPREIMDTTNPRGAGPASLAGGDAG
jgi:hypothetical protein